MSNDKASQAPPSPSQSQSQSRRRRSSIADLFARPGNINTNVNSNPNATPQAQPGQRRMSLTTLGLGIPGTSPTQPSPFGSMRRRDSVSSSVMSTSPTNSNNNNNTNNNGASAENAILEDDEGETPATTPSAAATSPFARRVSFGGVGGRARSGSGISPSAATAAAATATPSSASTARSGAVAVPRTSPFQFKRTPSHSQRTPTDTPSAEGFNWPEALRSRAERAPSFSTSPGSGGMQIPGMPKHQHHGRSASVASMEGSPRQTSARTDPIVDMPVQTPRVEQPPQKKKVNKPDYFQEKILRADFMD